MTSYKYKARDGFGGLATGHMEAESEKAVALQLEKQGFSPISITVNRSAGFNLQIEGWLNSWQKLKPQELVVFTRQLASTLEAGVPLVNSLEAVAEQINNRNFRAIVLQVVKDIQGGSTFSDALASHGKYFSSLMINMIRGGEKAGILPQVLERLSSIIEKDMETTDKIKSATRYPLIVLAVLAIAFTTLSVYVIPRFAGFFSSFKTELPLPTRILIGINFILVNFWYWIIGAFLLGGYLFYQFLGSEKGRYWWEKFVLSLPVFGSLFLKIGISRFSRMLSAMLNAGIPILDALLVTAATVDNKVLSKVILDIRTDVSQGKNLVDPMKKSKLFPAIAISMVAIGEKAGTLENMLNKTADYFDREIDYAIKNLTPLIEPILILGLAVIMILFALGIYLPMWEITKIYK